MKKFIGAIMLLAFFGAAFAAHTAEHGLFNAFLIWCWALAAAAVVCLGIWFLVVDD